MPFSSSLFFFVSPFPSCRSPFSPSFSIFVVFRSFLVSPSSSFDSFPPCSPWWRILFFCLGATPPTALIANLKVRVCIPLVCRLVSCVLVFNLFRLSSLSLFFDFDSDVVSLMLSFSYGSYAVYSVSVSLATRLAYDMYPIRTYADLTY